MPFGDRQLVLVTTTSVSLGGQLSRALPWLIALLGAALVILGAIVAERLLRRRHEAEALAADVSRLYEDQRHRAETLQRSLLPHELPQPPGVMAHARYWPADRSTQIGGDFYDLFALAGDRWGVIIGDVCGKGIEAAALTGVTRHTIRAAARHLESPADVLLWTYEAISAYSAETYATVCFAVLDLSHHEPQLDIALGGHPGPILCRADGTVETLGTPGTVLGLVEPKVTRTRHELSVGDTLVFYTDGVTDAPGERAVSMDDLTQAIVTAAPAGPAETADAIRVCVRRHRPEGNGDDTAILVLRLGDVVAASAAPSERRSRALVVLNRVCRCPARGNATGSRGAQMRNTWKGMIVGAFTGALVGFAMDMAEGAGESAAAVGHRLHERLPEATEQAQRAAQGAVDRVRDANVGDKLRDAAHRVADSDAVTKAKDLADHAAHR